ncbi:hypothetical protein JB92DRAFT_964216 [Gautieria morchelliformis]|nr:hypothetical protein JB92DRAFT_964216 [Gautieria morchelliformis]
MSSSTSHDWRIRVDCLGEPPRQFNTQNICKIFQEHVGAVVHISESLEGGKKWMKVVLSNEDGYKKALCMSGYSVGETRIQVSSFCARAIPSLAKPKVKHLARQKRGPDTRRNLYVLNVPHDLSAQAYHDLFTPHGTPTHTVLLKTQDSCSRRRGFVVMSTHTEAQEIINWLDGVCIRGFQLRVTWANIDRSNGFLSGYDRTSFGQDEVPLIQFAPPPPIPSIQPKCIGIGMDTSTIVASNIPISLFPAAEIDILFKPFGLIKSIQLLPLGPSPNHPLATLAPASPLAQTVIVTYEKAGDAIAARNTLHGQVYEGFGLAVGFVANLGKDGHQKQSASNVMTRCESTSAPTTATASRCGFDGGHNSSRVVPAEQNFRSLPVAPYDTVQFQYLDFPPARSRYGNWLPCSPFVPHTLTYQPQHALNTSIPYEATTSCPYL